MPALIRCVCGKRYRISQNALRKPICCKECGEELPLPDADTDDDGDESSISSDPGEDNESASPPRRARRGKKTGGGRSENSASMINTDLMVRGAGLLVFLATLIYAIHRFVFYEWPGNIPVLVKAIVVCWPMLIFGLIGLYIAWIGEEPDPAACRRNRIRGLTKCGIGVVMAVVGVALTAVSAKGNFRVIFGGLMGIGVLFVIFGFLGALTGREFKHRGDE